MSDLADQIDALLAINATGKVSHPVPGLAVELLEKAASALRYKPASKAREIEQQAWNCSEWPSWLLARVDVAVEVSQRLDMSTEQALGYAILSAIEQEQEPVAWRWKHPLWPDQHYQYGTHDPRIGTDDGVDCEPLYLSPSVEGKVGSQQRDHVYDPNDWEYTLPWSDRNDLVNEWDVNTVHKVSTLVDGPDKWVVLCWDEVNGEEIRWFESEADARAALTVALTQEGE